MAKEPNIVPLAFSNNWESHEYRPYSITKMDNEKDRVVDVGKLITKMDYVYVQEPGLKGFTKVKTKSYMVTETYSDMGHPGSATSMHYFIPTKVFGIEVEVPLDELIRKKPRMFFVDLNKIKTE